MLVLLDVQREAGKASLMNASHIGPSLARR